jgi:hypothetical protein
MPFFFFFYWKILTLYALTDTSNIYEYYSRLNFNFRQDNNIQLNHGKHVHCTHIVYSGPLKHQNQAENQPITDNSLEGKKKSSSNNNTKKFQIKMEEQYKYISINK